MIFVTGATGFIGSNLVRHFSTAQVPVCAFVRDGTKTPRIELPHVKIARGDVLRAGTLEYGMDGSTCVVHLVGIIRETKTLTFQQVHVEATRSALEAARKKGIERFVYVSALGARDDAKSAYHRTKWQAEEAVRSSGLNWTIVRPSVVYGPHGEFFNSTMALVRAPITPIIKPGMSSGLIQPIHIDDLAACLVKVATDEEGKTSGQVFECGGPNRLTTEQIIDTLALLSRRRIRKVAVPLTLAKLAFGIGTKLGIKTPATPEQLQMLRENNICNEGVLKETFGIAPRSFRDGVRSILEPAQSVT